MRIEVESGTVGAAGGREAGDGGADFVGPDRLVRFVKIGGTVDP